MDENTKIVLLAAIAGIVSIITAIVGYIVGKKRGNSKWLQLLGMDSLVVSP